MSFVKIQQQKEQETAEEVVFPRQTMRHLDRRCSMYPPMNVDSNNTNSEPAPPEVGAESGLGFTSIDWALGIFSLPVLVTTLMFATSGMTAALADRARRRRLLLILASIQLAIEIVAVVGVWIYYGG